MSINRVLAAATTLGVVVTLAAPALTSPANAGMTPVTRMATADAANRDRVNGANGGGHKPGGGGTGGGTNNLGYQGVTLRPQPVRTHIRCRAASHASGIGGFVGNQRAVNE